MYKELEKGFFRQGLSAVQSVFGAEKQTLKDARVAAHAFMPRWEDLTQVDGGEQFLSQVQDVCNFVALWESEITDDTERRQVCFNRTIYCFISTCGCGIYAYGHKTF